MKELQVGEGSHYHSHHRKIQLLVLAKDLVSSAFTTNNAKGSAHSACNCDYHMACKTFLIYFFFISGKGSGQTALPPFCLRLINLTVSLTKGIKHVPQ